MHVRVFPTKVELGNEAAADAAQTIRRAIAERGEAIVIAATGASQFELLDTLVGEQLEWDKVVFFHLDEYVNLPRGHPASFRKYLQERIVNRVHPREFVFIDGDRPSPLAECQRVGKLIRGYRVDLAMVGIGENGHLAFNDPPADLETEEPFLVVNLDERCRWQQLGEGWFQTLDEVPSQAISMSIPEILRARKILCVVPDQRKAQAVRDCLELEVGPLHPASALRTHLDATLFLDADSASLLAAGSV